MLLASKLDTHKFQSQITIQHTVRNKCIFATAHWRLVQALLGCAYQQLTKGSGALSDDGKGQM